MKLLFTSRPVFKASDDVPTHIQRLDSVLKLRSSKIRYDSFQKAEGNGICTGQTDCIDVQAGLRICCSHTTKSGFRIMFLGKILQCKV